MSLALSAAAADNYKQASTVHVAKSSKKCTHIDILFFSIIVKSPHESCY